MYIHEYVCTDMCLMYIHVCTFLSTCIYVTWLSSRVSMSSSLERSSFVPVRGWMSCSNSICAHVTSISCSVCSILSSLEALSTMFFTSSSNLCRLRANKSAKLVSSDMRNVTCRGEREDSGHSEGCDSTSLVSEHCFSPLLQFHLLLTLFFTLHCPLLFLQRTVRSSRTLTCVACISCSQCRSRMAGFCSSPTALSEVTMFFTVESSPVKASHARISLSSSRISCIV